MKQFRLLVVCDEKPENKFNNRAPLLHMQNSFYRQQGHTHALSAQDHEQSCTMANLTSYVPPAPIAPIAPDFAFCHPSYGVGMTSSIAMHAGGILPQGASPKLYTINDPEEPSGFYDLPYYTSFSGVAISVEIAGPVDIGEVQLIPNEIRGMAGYLANRCIGSRGTGGFITKGIQGLVDYVTNPVTDLDAAEYPDNTAVVTVMMSTPRAATFTGDYDPQMAIFLQQIEIAALGRVEPRFHAEIADRIIRYGVQAQRMRRLGHTAWWADPDDEDGVNRNGTGTIILRLANATALNTAKTSGGEENTEAVV